MVRRLVRGISTKRRRSVIIGSVKHVSEGLKLFLDPGMFMAVSRAPLLLISILVFSCIPVSVNADTVVRADPVELLPAGSFLSESDWIFSSQKAYSSEAADFSDSFIDDGNLILEHQRPENYQELVAWSQSSPTENNLSIGEPDCFRPTSSPVCDNDLDGDSDGGYSWSKGPVISLTGFDFSEGLGNHIVNVSLVVAFRVPDPLQQDSITFSIESGSNTSMVRTYAHSMSEINYMNQNAKEYSLDNLGPWTWSELSSLQINLDYVSVGQFDDSELQVDAAGIKVKFLKPWGTFELAEASHSSSVDHYPVLRLDLTKGSGTLAISNCGLEHIGGVGEWTFEELKLPYAQSWGRLHAGVDGNASWSYSSSFDGSTWSEESQIQSGEIIDTQHQFIRLHTQLLDGCIESVHLDINDPHFVVEGDIIGADDAMVPDFAKVRFAMNGEEIASTNITPGGFALSIPVGHLMSSEDTTLEIGISARFHWSSNGSSETISVRVDHISIAGGYLIEWDYDPQCSSISDQVFEEDGGGRLLDFLYTCTDDITPIADLSVTATSSNTMLLDANYVNGQIRIQPVSDAFGDTNVEVVVSDERGNTWVDQFAVIVTPVNDPPEMDGLPVAVTVELGETATLPFSYWDRDSPTSAVDIDITPEWVIYSAGMIEMTPLGVGEYIVHLTVTDDGGNSVSKNMTVIVTQQANIWVQSIDTFDRTSGSSSITQGHDVQIIVYVRNSGNSIAQPVSVRCSIDDQTIGTNEIAMISPGMTESTTCDDWSNLGVDSGEVELKIEVDYKGVIDETNELDNEWVTKITVNLDSDLESPTGENSSSLMSQYNSVWWVAVIILGLFAIVIFLYGPNQIRRVE